ncbi:RNA pyrophosphohydrolase [Magnetospira sp. QH-2]|uniref:RNA pyrophosphohydrolase n=1 Tax=Magnetospira sp. (strain QH-2) TaxID=1288970 RepID=UPI0003E80C29|nr:RNA pyrophosphohydrolase [Magnetospira sp. QH-2]CCQ74857.1 RNA pyrophosphohydrolase [Magnetospira sp. QH-2]
MSHVLPFEERPYRRGVGAVLFNKEGLVFGAQRIDTKQAAWQFPQGGIDDNERPKEALRRELKEEIGTDKAEIIGKSREWLSYDLPPEIADKVWKGRYRGQTQRWFALRFTGSDADIDLEATHAEFSTWQWLPFIQMPDLIVPFKRPLYLQLVDEFRHLVE